MDAFSKFQYQHNPARPLSWRWQRALYLSAHHERLSPERDDPETTAAVRFLAAARASRDQAALARSWPGLMEALALAGPCDRRQRWEVQARLLAGQDDDTIAARCNQTPAAVHWYEALFFNVRDRLAASDWIATRAIGPGLRRGFRPDEVGGVWRALGYYGGPIALDVVIPLTRAGLPIGAGASQSTAGEEPLVAAVRRAILAMMVPSNADPLQLFELHLVLRRLENLPKGSEKVRKALQQACSIVESLVASAKPELGSDEVMCEADADLPANCLTAVRVNKAEADLDRDQHSASDEPVVTDPTPPQTVGSRRKRSPRVRSIRAPGLQAAADDVVVAGSNQP